MEKELRGSALDEFVLHRVADGQTLTFLEILSEPNTLLLIHEERLEWKEHNIESKLEVYKPKQ